MTKEVMKLAIEALNTPRPSDSYPPLWRTYENTINTAIKALEEALKQEQVEPVAEVVEDNFSRQIVGVGAWRSLPNWTKLYTKPQTKEWVSLTNEQIVDLVIKNAGFPTKLAKAIEAKLKDKNK